MNKILAHTISILFIYLLMWLLGYVPTIGESVIIGIVSMIFIQLKIGNNE